MVKKIKIKEDKLIAEIQCKKGTPSHCALRPSCEGNGLQATRKWTNVFPGFYSQYGCLNWSRKLKKV